jgi:two-component system sensor histidine kinase UhpB
LPPVSEVLPVKAKTTPLHILLIEDSQRDAALILRALEQGGLEVTARRIDSAPVLEAALQSQVWDVILCDYVMPQFGGPQALEVLKRSGRDLPFIVVSGAITEDTAVPLLRSGAHDYVTKGNLARLAPAIERELREADERRKRREAEEEVRRQDRIFRSLIENGSDIILMVERDGGVLYASPSVQRVLGYRGLGLTGGSLFAVVHPGDRAAADDAVSKASERVNVGPPSELRVKHQDGSWRVLEILVSKPVGDTGNAGIVINCRDITDRKQIEAELRSHQVRLRELAASLSLTEQQERRRIAGGLHDCVAQPLALARMKLGVAQQLTSSREVAENLADVKQLVEEAIKDVRSLTFEISPPILHESGLEAALEWLADEMKARYGIDVGFRDSSGPIPLEEDIRVFLFWSVRELLINVAKHAHSPSAYVSVGRSGRSIRIEVRDEGVGFGLPDAARRNQSAGFGLFSIRERLAALGGNLEIGSRPGEGARVCLIAPLSLATADKKGTTA